MQGRSLIYPSIVRPVPTADQALPRVDKFGQPLSTPPAFLHRRSIPMGARQHWIAAPAFEDTQAPARWFRPLSEPPVHLRPRRLETGLQQAFAFHNQAAAPFAPNDSISWHVPLAEPAKYLAPRRLETGSQQTFAFQNPAPIFIPTENFSYWRDLEIPPKLREARRVLPGAQPAMFMVLHYPRLPVTYLEGYAEAHGDALTVSATAFSQSSTNASAYTFSGLSFGAAHADRYVIVAVGFRTPAAAAALSSVTIGGVTADLIHSVTASASVTDKAVVGFYSAKIATGTSGDVVVTLSATAARCGVQAWRVIGEPVLYDTGSDTETTAETSMQGDVDVVNGSVALGAVIGVGSGSHSYTWLGLTEDNDAGFAGEATSVFSTASKALAANETLAITATATDHNTNSSKALGVISFRPKPTPVTLIGFDDRTVYLTGYYRSDSDLG